MEEFAMLLPALETLKGMLSGRSDQPLASSDPALPASPTITAPPQRRQQNVVNALESSSVPIPSTPSTISSSLERDPKLHIPFQLDLWTLSNNTSAGREAIFGAIPEIVNLLAPYRRARVLQLEAVVAPTANVTDGGLTVIVAWVPANSSPVGETALNVPGSQLVTYTGATVSGAPTIVPAPLNALNPMVKDSVAYVDAPKLHLSQFETGSKGDVGRLVLRGTIEVSSPSIQPLQPAA